MGHYQLQVNSPSRMTLRDVLSKPTIAPPTTAEKKVAKHLVGRLLSKSPQQVIKISTRGQVSTEFSILDIRSMANIYHANSPSP